MASLQQLRKVLELLIRDITLKMLLLQFIYWKMKKDSFKLV